MTLEDFQSQGSLPWLMDMLNRSARGCARWTAPSFSSLPGIQSGPDDLEGSIDFRILRVSSSLTVTEDSCGLLKLREDLRVERLEVVSLANTEVK